MEDPRDSIRDLEPPVEVPAQANIYPESPSTQPQPQAIVETGKHPGGRPRWLPTPEEMERARKMASQGMTLDQIAAALGISYDTLNERRKEIPQFADLLRSAKGRAIEAVTNRLFVNALRGNVVAAIFWLKNQAGWKDRAEFGGVIGVTDLDQKSEVPNGGPIIRNTPERAATILRILAEARSGHTGTAGGNGATP